MSAPYTFNFSAFFGPLVNKWRSSPTNAVRQTAQMVHVFAMITLGTMHKFNNPVYTQNVLDGYQTRMGGFLPRFMDALAQEKMTWVMQNPNATPDQQATFDAQQAQALDDFATQLMAWHTEFYAEWSQSPSASQ
jgi:hypothetical protein